MINVFADGLPMGDIKTYCNMSIHLFPPHLVKHAAKVQKKTHICKKKNKKTKTLLISNRKKRENKFAAFKKM